MPRAEVMYHFVRGKTDGTNFPDRALVELFRTANVSLKLTLGVTLEPRETLRPSELIDRWKPNNASIGHLVISNQCKDPRYLEIAGQLVDLSSRGVAFVYLNSPPMRVFPDREEPLLQTSAHEIGHMFNLGHGDTSTAYTSAMEQAATRSHRNFDSWDLAYDAAWKAAQLESDRASDRHEDPFFDPPQMTLKCFPFAASARRKMNGPEAKKFLPWAGKFDPDYPDGADDRA